MNVLVYLKNARSVLASRAIAMAAALLVNVVLVMVFMNVFTCNMLYTSGASFS